jgi:hypothetical protein
VRPFPPSIRIIPELPAKEGEIDQAETQKKVDGLQASRLQFRGGGFSPWLT